MSLKLGSPAPAFKATAFVAGQKDFPTVSLKDYAGKWVVLFFYPRDFTFVCPTEIKSFQDHEAQFKELGAQVIACSTDSEFTHKAWFEKDLASVKYPVLADTNHAIARDYTVLDEGLGLAHRGTFIIDPKGNLAWYNVSALGVGRNVGEVVRAISALKTGELCPANWTPGQATIKT